MLEGRHLAFLGVAAALVWQYSASGPADSYWHRVDRWAEDPVPYLPPVPVDQALLYRTAPELPDPVAAEASGAVPAWLAGTLIRDGPGLFEFGAESAVHSFDGMAMLRRYLVGPGPAGPAMNYSRRLLDTDILRSNRAAGSFTKYGVGTPAGHTGVMQRLRGLAEEGADNVVVQSIHLFGHCYAATELPVVVEYDPETLDTLGRVDVSGRIPGIKLMTPHPMYEPDGTMWNIAMAMGPDREGNATSSWRYVVFKVPPPTGPETEADPWAGLQVVTEVPSSRSLAIAYLHSFFMTENYIVFPEQPWVIGDILSVLVKHVVQGDSVASTMYWDAGAPLRFHVVEKASGRRVPLHYEADPMGFFHIINAYEDAGHIVLDAPFKSTPVSYSTFMVEPLASSPEVLRRYMVDTGPASGTSKRWVLPLSLSTAFSSPDIRLAPSGRIDPDSFRQVSKLASSARAWHTAPSTLYLHPEPLAPAAQYSYHRAFEFAGVNPRLQGRKYRYAYGLGFPTGYLVGSIHKLDVETKQFTHMWEDPACRATEPQFVPRPGGTEEEDGVVVSACLGTDPSAPSTSLVVLHPRDLTELGRFSVPHTTPVGFHGIWLPQ